MRRSIVHIVFIGVWISCYGLSQRVVYAQEAEIEKLKPLTIHLVTEPGGAMVFNNDSLLGTTPIDLAGSTSWGKIRFIYPSISDWNAVEKEIDLTNVKPIQGIFRVLLPKKITINTIPFGAEVIEHDSLLGKTPFIYDLADESATLTLRKFNYDQYALTLHHTSESHITIPLRKSSTHFDEELVTQHNTTFQIPKTSVIVTAAVGLAAGITSVALKAHADHLYDQYTSTVQEDFLKKTRTYDLYAGAAYILLQASVAYLVYLLLTD